MRAIHAEAWRYPGGRSSSDETPTHWSEPRGAGELSLSGVSRSRSPWSSPEPLARAAAASRSGPGTKRRRKPGAAARGLEQLVQRRLEVVGELLEVLHRVVVADQAEVDLAVVAHDPDAERLALGQRHHREDRAPSGGPSGTAGTAGRGRW